MFTYGWTQHYCLWKLTLPQLYLWYDKAAERNYGKKAKIIDAKKEAEKIKANFEWDEKNKRWT